jgi:hypothetical protein
VFGVAITDLILDDQVPRIFRALMKQLFWVNVARGCVSRAEMEKVKNRIDSGAPERWRDDPFVITP